MKWVLLTTAPDQLQAEMWRDLLVEDGFKAIVRPGDTTSFLGVSPYPCRILVADDELERASDALETRLAPRTDEEADEAQSAPE